MIQFLYLFANTALVMGCFAMAIVFLTLPLPTSNRLNKYRTSLRFLAGAYLLMALVNLAVICFDVAMVNLISMDVLVVGLLQATLFTSTLITLINPQFVTKHYLNTQVLPILLLIIFYFLAVYKWGNPQILTFEDLKLQVFHPTVVIREVFFFYYVYQLLYLTFLFRKQEQKYEKEIDDYFGDNYHLQLKGVKYSFYAALTVGIGALISCLLVSTLWVLIFTIAYTIFYLVFGVYYIQYPSVFFYIEPAIYPTVADADILKIENKRLVWAELKHQIIDDKYFIRPDVNIEEMAQYLKIGRTTLSNFINKEEEMNFHAWMNTLRVEEAQQLFNSYPDYSISQVADMIGFSEPTNFSRQFKLITSHSPSAWKQIHLQKSEM